MKAEVIWSQMQRAKQRSIKKMNAPYVVYFQSHFDSVIHKAYLIVLASVYIFDCMV